MKRIAMVIAAAGLSIGLSACSGTSHGPVTQPPPPTPLADKFGTGFGQDFQASASATPNAVKAGDTIPVDPTAAPTSLH